MKYINLCRGAVLFAFSIFTVEEAIAEDSNAWNYKENCFSDLALIYQGGTHRPDWTAEDLAPYVTHTFADGHTDWFFDSFLFFEFTDNWQVAFGYKYGARNATKKDWEWLLNRIFEKEKSLDALNSCIKYYKTIIGEPGFKHKIVLGIVSPITGQTDWGDLDGEKLDFNIQTDQIKAAKWYIDELVKRFSENAYDNLELEGFYWLEESTVKCGDLPEYINRYVHLMGKKSYWIPYWYAPGFDQWKSLGFDIAFLQPNHFFDKTVLDARLRDAYKLAKKFGMGLEMEFDSKVLYENEDTYYPRLETYIDAFEKYGVFENAVIAYYSGTKAILDMYRSDYIENTLVLDRIASNVVDRRNRKAGSVGETNIPENNIKVIGGKGEIYITGYPESVKIYTIGGQLVSENKKRIECVPGIYLVSVSGECKKVIVR